MRQILLSPENLCSLLRNVWKLRTTRVHTCLPFPALPERVIKQVWWSRCQMRLQVRVSPPGGQEHNKVYTLTSALVVSTQLVSDRCSFPISFIKIYLGKLEDQEKPLKSLTNKESVYNSWSLDQRWEVSRQCFGAFSLIIKLFLPVSLWETESISESVPGDSAIPHCPELAFISQWWWVTYFTCTFTVKSLSVATLFIQ